MNYVNVAREKYGSTCQSSSQFSSTFSCENALNPFWITSAGWASQTAQVPRPWIKIFFSKIFYIAELCIVQRFAKINYTFKEVKITIGSIIDKIYLLNYNSTCFLFENETGMSTTEVKAEGHSYIDREYANGFNSIQAYILTDGMEKDNF